jgi:hypothetical protein
MDLDEFAIEMPERLRLAVADVIHEVAQVIAPHMGIRTSALRYPHLKLSIWPCYDIRTHTLPIHGDDICFLNHPGKSVAHEVSHFLHGTVQPQLMRAYYDDPEKANLCEIIAFLGEAIHASTQSKSVLRARKNAAQHLDGRTLVELAAKYRPMTPEEEAWSYEFHEGGYKAVNYLQKYYGLRGLRDLPRMDVPQAKRYLKARGYRGKLHLKYQKKKEEITSQL